MKLNDKQIEALTKKAFKAAQKAAVKAGGTGYDRVWKLNPPSLNAGFIEFTKYVLNNHKK